MNTEREPIEINDAIAIIEKTIEKEGLECPEGDPERLPLNRLCTMVGLFQRRELEGRLAEDERHISTLRKALGSNPDRPKPLTPITIWWGGDRWYVIDGHHRRQAYRIAKVTVPVPVQVFKGTLADALKHAAAANSKDHLRMTKEDKMTSAWCLTVLGKHSKTEVCDACAVSDGSVASMRRTLRKLRSPVDPNTKELYSDTDLLKMTWEEAQSASNGDPLIDWEHRDEAAERTKRALGYSRRMHRYFGDRHVTDVEAFAEGLSITDASLPQRYVETEVWQTALEDVMLDAPREAVMALINELADRNRGLGREHHEAIEQLRVFAEDQWDNEDNPDY